MRLSSLLLLFCALFVWASCDSASVNEAQLDRVASTPETAMPSDAADLSSTRPPGVRDPLIETENYCAPGSESCTNTLEASYGGHVLGWDGNEPFGSTRGDQVNFSIARQFCRDVAGHFDYMSSEESDIDDGVYASVNADANGNPVWAVEDGTHQIVDKISCVYFDPNLIVGLVGNMIAEDVIIVNGSAVTLDYFYIFDEALPPPPGLPASGVQVLDAVAYAKSSNEYFVYVANPYGTVADYLNVSVPSTVDRYAESTVTWTGSPVDASTMRIEIHQTTAPYSVWVLESGVPDNGSDGVDIDQAPGSTYEIYVESNTYPGIRGTSNSFTISDPSNVTGSISPTGTVTTSINVDWQTSPSNIHNSVTVFLKRSGHADQVLDANGLATGDENYNLTSYSAGSGYYIRVRSNVDASVYWDSSTFTIASF